MIRTVEAYVAWLGHTATPKLLVTVSPGAIVEAVTAELALRTRPDLTHVHLGPGGRFVPDEHGPALAAEILRWVDGPGGPTGEVSRASPTG